MLSRIVQNMVPSGTVEINARVFELKEAGVPIINLSVGEPDFDTPEAVKEGAARAMKDNLTRYDKAAGLAELREAVCRKLRFENGLDYTPDQIVISNGAKQCIINACLALLDPGDEVIIPAPYWVSYPEIVKIAGGVPVFVQPDRKNDFKLTAEDIEAAATDRTRMVVLCNPSNPLGTVHSREELTGIAEVCVRRGIYILADEVYERICFADEFVSMASVSEEVRDLTILINGLSKSIPMTGWRIGYSATSAEIARAFSALQGHMTFHPSIISQWAGVAALNSGSSYTEMMTAEYRKRMEAAVEFLQKELPEIPFVKPEGAFYLFLDISCLKDALADIPGGSGSYSTDFTMKLLNEKHVAVVPGSAFGMEGFLRLAYANDIENILEGLSRFRDLVRELTV